MSVSRCFTLNRDYYSFNTWCTLHSFLSGLNDLFLNEKLRTSPKDDFVTHHLNKILFGKLFTGWENAVGCPRANEIESLVKELEPFVNSDEAAAAHADEIKAIIGKIDRDSGNYSSYVRPTDEELRMGTTSVLSRLITELDTSTYLIIERVTYDALWNHCPDSCHTFFRKESEWNVGSAATVTLVECTSGHRAIVLGLVFMAMAEEASVQNRMNAIQTF